MSRLWYQRFATSYLPWPAMRYLGALLMFCALTAQAAQIDIPGPAGIGAFGSGVDVLPNGNIVVIDPTGPVSNVGAVYLHNWYRC
jgi:hypothetical protein